MTNATPMTEKTKQDFIHGYTQSCLQAQYNDPGSKNFTNSQLTQYCSCVARKTAALINYEDIQLINQTKNAAHIQARVESSARACIP
jgi:hypothetical protein